MIETSIISPAVIESVESDEVKNPRAKKIYDLALEIENREKELARMRFDLDFNKTFLPVTPFKWRDSIRWCLEIDSENPMYFLKGSIGISKCIAFKHGIDISPDMKNKIASTVSAMFKEQTEIGRIDHNGTHYYGLAKFFKENLTELREEYEEDLKKLIS